MSTIRFVNIHCNYFDAILDTIYQKLSSLMPPCTICLKMQISAIIPSTCNVPHYWVGRVVGSPGNVPRRWFSYRIWPDAIYRDKPKLGKRWYRSYHQKIIFSGRGMGELPESLPFLVAQPSWYFRIIESNPPVQKIPLIYPPTTPHPSPIYNTIDMFPRDLLPNFGPPTIQPQSINTVS